MVKQVGKKKKVKLVWSVILATVILVLGFSIFFISYPEEYHKIKASEDFATISDDSYFKIEQNYEIVEPENFERMLTKLISKSRYDKICFRDEGSKLNPSFVRSALVFVEYQNETRQVAKISETERLIFSNEECFNITSNVLNWTWRFDDGDQYQTWVKTFPSETISPKVSTYLKTRTMYYFGQLFISIFYAGIFVYALTRIIKIIKDGWLS